uniref:Uncharacterized protein n=1 Tax=Nelumbo nucifera TaxID=4432 RepID=A0A822YDB1_NELNU|nr:TPA_asm: hypothetical protein HUJ06_030433 [Nelumbo nucifera]
MKNELHGILQRIGEPTAKRTKEYPLPSLSCAYIYEHLSPKMIHKIKDGLFSNMIFPLLLKPFRYHSVGEEVQL